MQAARIAYYTAPYNAEQFTWEEYLSIVMDEVLDTESILCYHDGALVGAVCISHVIRDMHIPGTGVHVYHTIVDPAHPRATILMYRFLIDQLRQIGASWYNTTRRVSAHEFTSKFRRLHG